MSDDERMSKGVALVGRLFKDVARTGPVSMSPELTRYTIEHLFGDVWHGPGLALEERSLLTCTILIALGRENEQRLHFQAARNLGIPREKLEAAIAHIAHYAGWPVAISANAILQEVWPPAP